MGINRLGDAILATLYDCDFNPIDVVADLVHVDVVRLAIRPDECAVCGGTVYLFQAVP